jgi:hypothetical protein
MVIRRKGVPHHRSGEAAMLASRSCSRALA